MKIPISRPTRLLIVSAIVWVLFQAKVKADNYRKAVILSNNIPGVLTATIVDSTEKVVSSIAWDNMLIKMNSILESSELEKIPTLFSLDEVVLADRAKVSITQAFDQHEIDVTKELSDFLEVKLPLVSNLAMSKLRDEITGYTSDYETLDTFEKNLDSVASSILETVRATLLTNATERFTKLRGLFDDVLSWKMLSYYRFLSHALQTKQKMDPNLQLETWVELETQSIVGGSHLVEYLNPVIFDEYLGNSSGFMELLDSKYGRARPSSKLDSDVDEIFTRRAPNVDSILASQSAFVYLLRIEAIDADVVLDDQQKRALKTFAMESRQKLDESSVVPEDTSLEVIRSLYANYMNRFLEEVRVFILVIFLRYESISLRAIAEGRQTCIVQYFQFRRSLNDAFFFRFCQERSFDLVLTETDFKVALGVALDNSHESVFGLVDTSYLHYMFGEASSYSSSKAISFFKDDLVFLGHLRAALDTLQDTYAQIIPRHLQAGIDLEASEQKTMTKISIESSFERFLGDVEYYFISELINLSRVSILEDLVNKIGEVYGELTEVSAVLVREGLAPFGSAYFDTASDLFITDDDIDYSGLRAHVVSETNARAVVALESTRLEYKTSFTGLGAKVFDFIGLVSSDLGLVVNDSSDRVDSARKASLLENSDSTLDAMSVFASEMMSSMTVRLEDVLRDALAELDGAQETRLMNFFNTKVQLIRDSVTTRVADLITKVFQDHLDTIDDKMFDISIMARSIFREHVDLYLELEKRHRAAIAVASKPGLDEISQFILAEYNAVSFGARESLFKAEMKESVRTSAESVLLERLSDLADLKKSWDTARLEHRAYFYAVAEEAKASFRDDLLKAIEYAKLLSVDIIGHMDEILTAFDRDLFGPIEAAYANIIDVVIGSDDNLLPLELTMVSVIFSPGIMDLTDAPEIPSDAFRRSYEEPDENTLRDEDGNILPEVDHPSGMTTEEIVMALMEWDLWILGKIDELVYLLLASMQDELIQNTCYEKPPCRDGWKQDSNEFGVPCCTFDPEADGFFTWQIAGMLALELVLAVVLDIEFIVMFGPRFIKASSYMGQKLASTRIGKSAISGQKMMVRSLQKWAGTGNPARMTRALKFSASMGKNGLKTFAAGIGKTAAGKAATRMAVKFGSMGAKMLAKLSAGPAAIALMIFDVVSLILDMWDPAGYNEMQNAGMLRVERDEIEKYYHDILRNSGFESPLLADPMYHMSQAEQSQLYDDTFETWLSDKMADFLTANEERFELLANYEILNETMAHSDAMFRLVDDDPNIMTNLMAEKLENVFTQDISVRENHKNPYTEGGTNSQRTASHYRQSLEPSGILEISLTESGVAAHNLFMEKKAPFMNSMKYNEMYRYVKRVNNYYVTKASEIPRNNEVGTQCEITFDYMSKIIETNPTAANIAYDPEGVLKPLTNWWNGLWGNDEAVGIKDDCVRPDFPALTPTEQGSLDFADILGDSLDPGGSFAAEIRANVEEGWVLQKVDAEEEFFVQYDPEKTEAELLDRTTYQKAHEDNIPSLAYSFENLMDSVIAGHVEKLREEKAAEGLPETDEPVSIGHIKVLHLSKNSDNWTLLSDGTEVLKYPMSDEVEDFEKITYTMATLPYVPSWVPAYDSIYDEYIVDVEDELEATHEANQIAIGEAHAARNQAERERLVAKALAETEDENNPKYWWDVQAEESVLGRTSQPDHPTFAVFVNGYGQNSPLYSIANECKESGDGVTYDKNKGLCNFTQSYCRRYGVDFFFNNTLGVYDCELSDGQNAAEYIFGTTITRSTRRGYVYLMDLGSSKINPNPNKIGSCRKALGSVKMSGGVLAKHVQNAEHQNYVDTSTTLDVIQNLGLSGF